METKHEVVGVVWMIIRLGAFLKLHICKFTSKCFAVPQSSARIESNHRGTELLFGAFGVPGSHFRGT